MAKNTLPLPARCTACGSELVEISIAKFKDSAWLGCSCPNCRSDAPSLDVTDLVRRAVWTWNRKQAGLKAQEPTP